MVGMTALAPVLAHLLGPVIIPLYEMLGANPSMFAGTLLACDPGAVSSSLKNSRAARAAWMYSGLILGSMMGPTIVFSIPVALGIIRTNRSPLAGARRAGGHCHHSHRLYRRRSGGDVFRVEINGQPVWSLPRADPDEYDPVIIVAVLVALGLKLFRKNDQRLQIFAKFLVALVTIGLAAAVIKFLLGWGADPGLDPIFVEPWRPARRGDARHRSHWLLSPLR